MAKSRAFWAALLSGWVALSVGGIVYARFKDIPSWAALPVISAFLLEYPFYLVSGFPELRKRISGALLPVILCASTLLPYLACYAPLGQFHWVALLKLAAVIAALALWYVVLPVSAATDIAFLAFTAAVLLSNYFDVIYPDPYPGVKIAILGRIALFRSTVLILLLQRRIQETGYGFVPNWREWRVGLLHYVSFLPVAAAIALPLEAVHYSGPAPPWKTAGIFVGFFWVIALFEEFIFRGVLQQWIEQWTAWHNQSRRAAALLVTSALFGCAHLWFRGFPNWRWALIAFVLGWFCGHARNQSGSIRAGVVTHALAVATWRGFFA